MLIAAGLMVLIAGLVCALASIHFKGLRYFDRPELARHPVFDRVLDLAQWILVLAGLGLLARGSRVTFAVVGGLLVLAWGWRRLVRSVPFQARLLRRQCEAMRRQHPGAKENDLLRLLVVRRHQEWGEELIDQMVRDYPSIERLSVMMVRMERGFRGFRGGVRRAAARSGPGPRS